MYHVSLSLMDVDTFVMHMYHHVSCQSQSLMDVDTFVMHMYHNDRSETGAPRTPARLEGLHEGSSLT